MHKKLLSNHIHFKIICVHYGVFVNQAINKRCKFAYHKTLALAEFEFYNIDRCIDLVNEKLNFPKAHHWRQHDYELLIEEIYSATKTQISLSTIKRIWNHSNKYVPRISTLDAIAQYLGYKSWSYFSISANNQNSTARTKEERSGMKFYFPMMLVLIAVLVLYFILDRNSSQEIITDIDIANVKFSHNKTVKIGVPTSVIFNYDLNGLETDSAYIQASWNRLERFPIKTNGFIRTLMYYYPGWHEAKLIIGNRVLKTEHVYVRTDGWVSLLREEPDDVSPIYLDSEMSMQNGMLYSSNEVLNLAKADTSLSDYYVSHFNTRDFGAVADDFFFETRIKNPSKYGKFSCQLSSFYIHAERSGIFLTFGGIGCSSKLRISVGGINVLGIDEDLSNLSADFSEWQNIKVKVKDKKFVLIMNDKVVYELEYTEEMGALKSWHYFFNGSGAVDFLKIRNEKDEIVFYDDFD